MKEALTLRLLNKQTMASVSSNTELVVISVIMRQCDDPNGDYTEVGSFPAVFECVDNTHPRKFQNTPISIQDYNDYQFISVSTYAVPLQRAQDYVQQLITYVSNNNHIDLDLDSITIQPAEDWEISMANL